MVVAIQSYLSGPFKIGGWLLNIVLASTPSTPGGSSTCTASYAMTQENIEHGSIMLNVDANAKAGSSDNDVTANRSLILNLLQQPLLFISESSHKILSISQFPLLVRKHLVFCP